MEMPTSALTGVTLKDMFDAGLHFGHQTKRWNPKMKGYIFDKRNGIHIIDLQQSVELLDEAAAFVRETILAGKKLLFVATKKQMAEMVKTTAQGVDQFYVTERWLGGTLTNAKTLRTSVKRMRQLQATAKANGGQLSEHKQENSMLRRELAKLETNLTGVAEMAEQPGAVVIIDCVKEANAVREAVRLHIPVVAVVGFDESIEGEESDSTERNTIALPASQRSMLDYLYREGFQVVLVVMA
ncbi:MAG: 30S ribosomal protein S2, partial [Kiritimatiellae bacterium]|nr:30S ribosomal protein S2 [Kiritimatiellia bacterium]